MYLVFPNEYVLMDQSVYNIYSSSFFVVEFAVLMAVLGGMALVAEGAWRKIYWQLFGASALYLLSYQWLNSALNRNEYYSGSIYDVPDYAAICWLILIAVRARHVPSERLGGTGERDIYLYDRQTQKLLPTPGLNSRDDDYDPCVIVLPVRK